MGFAQRWMFRLAILVLVAGALVACTVTIDPATGSVAPMAQGDAEDEGENEDENENEDADENAGEVENAGEDENEIYSLEIDPSEFVETVDNDYFPLAAGARYVYEGLTEEGVERVEIEVLAEKREVMGIQATVVRDVVYLEGEVIEETLDWFAQDSQGNVWYLGEEVHNYADGQLVDTSGSWEAGVDGALPGFVMLALPADHVGAVYRQEYYAGEAEDMAQIVSAEAMVDLASGERMATLQTREWTPLEPDAVHEFKFYAPGIGMVREEKVDGSEVKVLVDYAIP